ncbi:transmembrane protein 42-like isoform X3 [Dreissena polymorpha]|nr:transmembrane protein 42-like isoform X3 [Dreissena polymorpha]
MLLHPARLENVVHRKGHIKSERFGSLWFSNCNGSRVLGVVHCMVSESMPDKITNHQLGISLAVCAGAMAAMASVSAKLAMTEDTVHAICSGILAGTQLMALCDTLLYVLRAGCFASIFIFNSLMWTLFTKSLQHCSSTIEATITNTGANFLITALLGVLLFGERLSLLWWLGSCLILAGLLLIHKGNKETEETSDKAD